MNKSSTVVTDLSDQGASVVCEVIDLYDVMFRVATLSEDNKITVRNLFYKDNVSVYRLVNSLYKLFSDIEWCIKNSRNISEDEINACNKLSKSLNKVKDDILKYNELVTDNKYRASLVRHLNSSINHVSKVLVVKLDHNKYSVLEVNEDYMNISNLLYKYFLDFNNRIREDEDDE